MAEQPQQSVDNRQPDGTFGAGNNANPGGRPRGSFSIMNIIRKKMEEIPLGQTKEWKEQFAEIILDEAVVKRNPHILKLVVEYMDGKPDQKIDFGVDKENISDLTALLGGLAKKVDVKNDRPQEPNGEGAK